MHTLTRWLAAAIGAALSWLPAHAQSTEPTFSGKPLRIVTSAAGGEYDMWARIISRHLGRHVPGNPTVIVQNMPGAGDMLAANWLYNVAPRDGTVWGTISRNIPNAAFQGQPAARYDPTKFQWLGSPEMTNRGCFATPNAKVQKAEDLFQHELIVGGIGAGAAVTETPTLLRGVLGMKFKIVDGYIRPQDVVLAMDRGEVEGLCQTLQSFTLAKPDWFKSGTARLLFTTESEPVPGMNVPTAFQFAKTDEQRAILAFTASSLDLGRPYMLPPGVPPQIVQVMRRAFDATVNDPLLREEVAKTRGMVTHKTGEQIQDLIMKVAATPKEIIERANELTKR
jgi:tripartite-type tricarboxylate transporter receptor subunit TctC